jgi:cell division septal protein FtsQ
MALATQHGRSRRSWKDSRKAKTIAAVITLLLIVCLVVLLANAFLSMS